jgi:hypothetical protein
MFAEAADMPQDAGVPNAAVTALAAALLEVLFSRVTQTAANAGHMDMHRALDHFALRPSALSATRRIVDVGFSFTNRATDAVETFSTRVDTTKQFPFPVTEMSPFDDR